MADEPSTQPAASSSSRKKACTECRQQKAKCDAYLSPNDACSRCRKMGTQCIISAPFRRENKRQRLSELETETDALRKRLRTEDLQPSFVEHAQVIGSDRHENNVPRTFETSGSPGTGDLHAAALLSDIHTTASALNHSQTLDEQIESQIPTTVSRDLDGVTVSAKDINNIFKLFFNDYSPWLPILDARLSPDACYQQSPLLFWAIIGTACRSYTQNPTLLSALTKGIIRSALLSVSTSRAPLQRIQAFLLLVTWPLFDAVEANQQETNYVLGGLLLHLALRTGMHVPAGSDEFFRAKLPSLPDMGIVGRSELWNRCILAYQRTCFCKGFLARTSFDISPETEQYQSQHKTLPAALRLRLKWQNICVQCGAAISENGMRNLTREQDRALSIIVRTFESQIKDLESQAENESDLLECNLAKLYLRSFYFLKEDVDSFPEVFDKIQKIARQVITDVERLMNKTKNPVSIPYYINCALLFATFSLLRILKTSVPLPSGESEEAKSAFFHAIGLVKQATIDSNDMYCKGVTMLTQLWNSSRAFKRPDGSVMPVLRARSRLNGSHVVDAVLWWIEEFDPQFQAQLQNVRDSAIAPADTSNTNDNSDPANSQQNLQQTTDLGDTSLFDFDWFMNTNLSFPQDFLNFQS